MISGVQIGQVLAGKYRVDKILGTGGMGYVVACQHMQLQQKVALKFLHAAMLENEEIVGRFLREAQAAVQIKSEHVVRVSDVGTLEDGVPYMVMEYLEGTDLKETLEANGPLPIPTAVDYLLQACEALAEAHVAGIIHRDLKPNNLFLAKKADGRACVKVLDFGISKISASTPGVGNLTRTAATLGTPFYMAPEQLTSTRSVDVRADIWALGVVLYELVSGATPFTGETLAELCIRIVQEQPVPLSTVNPAVPLALWTVITRCLHKDRDQRYANVAEVAAALAPFGTSGARMSLDTISRIIPTLTPSQTQLAAHVQSAPGAASGDVAHTHSATTGQVAWGQTNLSAGPRAKTSLVIAVGAVGLIAMGALAWFLHARTSATSVSSSSPSGLPSLATTAQPAVPSAVRPEPTPSVLAATTAANTATNSNPQAQPVVLAPVQQSPAEAQAPSAAKVTDSKLPKRPKANPAERAAKSNSVDLIEDRR